MEILHTYFCFSSPFFSRLSLTFLAKNIPKKCVTAIIMTEIRPCFAINTTTDAQNIEVIIPTKAAFKGVDLIKKMFFIFCRNTLVSDIMMKIKYSTQGGPNVMDSKALCIIFLFLFNESQVSLINLFVFLIKYSFNSLITS